MNYKNQHSVPVSYMKAWCDPSTPEGQTPYVWVVSKNGKSIEKKAPKNIFSGADFYTIYDSNGNRDVRLEQYLHTVEDNYLHARNNIANTNSLSDNDIDSLIEFVVTAYSRTNLQKIEQQLIWEELISIYKLTGLDQTLPKLFNQLKLLQKQPMEFHVINLLQIATPILRKMNIELLITSSDIGFITSDNPVFWIDGSIFRPDSKMTFLGLGSPLLEIILPINPKVILRISTEGPKYSITNIDSHPNIIDAINELIVANCEKSVIINHGNPCSVWFNSTRKIALEE